jgi:hypothetical protein
MREKTDEFAIIRDIRRSLAEWLESSTEARLPVSRIMKSLDSLEDLIQERAAGGHKSVVGAQRGRTRAKYTVEHTPNGEMLVEGRAEGKSPPFRVAKSIYDAVAGVFSSATRPLKFEDVLEQLKKSLTVQPADFQVRACLRFWLSFAPPLLVRSRSSYHVVDPSTFTSATQSAWKASQ